MAKLHGRATTTPLIRKAIQESNDTVATLAARYNINPKTVIKWKHRATTEDQKCGPESKSKSLTPAQEAIAIAVRKQNQFSIEDCFYILKPIIPHLSLSSLYRSYKRHGVNRLETDSPKKTSKKFKAYNPGYLHVDITQVYTEEGKLYLFVGIDRTTKFCFVRLYKNQTAKIATAFLREMHRRFPNKITHILTDNGLQFTCHKGEKEAHIFNKTCLELGIEHRTTQPYHPWTNGQVERMNRTLKEATIKKFYYQTHERLEKHLKTFVDAYNYTQPLKSLSGKTPYEKVSLYLQSEQGKSYLNPTYKTPECYS